MLTTVDLLQGQGWFAQSGLEKEGQGWWLRLIFRTMGSCRKVRAYYLTPRQLRKVDDKDAREILIGGV